METNNKPHHDRIVADVLRKINAGEIKMRPKLYFTIKVIIVFVVALLALCASSLLISFIIFTLQASGKSNLLGFGTKGVGMFLELFPWSLFVIVLVLLVVLEWLVKRFRFGWERSRGQLIVLILISSFFFGLIISSTSFHSLLHERAQEKRLSILGDVYRDIIRPEPEHGIFRGNVTAVQGNIFIIHNDDEPWEKGYLIFAPPGVDLEEIIEIGDKVFVAASKIRGELRAIGIKKVQEYR